MGANDLGAHFYFLRVMSYVISLIDRNRSITREIVRKAIEMLPERLKSDWPTEHDTGWSLIADVSISTNPDGIDYLVISGSESVSGRYSLDITLAMQQILQHLGFRIDIFSFSFGYINRQLYIWLGYDPDELSDIEPFIH